MPSKKNKPKLHKATGLSRPNFSNASQNSQQPSTSTQGPTLTVEQQEQFQYELHWCIKQLQWSLETNKLSPKEVAYHTKKMNSLMNDNTPFIMKRCTMKELFGDYRAKIRDEEKRATKLSIKIGSKPSDKSTFVRKALSESDKNFCFNFPLPDEDSKRDNGDCQNVQITHPKHPAVPLSDNSFRFNFALDDCQET